MYVQLICKDRNEKEMNELYEVLDAICHREGVQIEDRLDHVDILVCPQGKIVVTEEGKDMYLTANTRHAGAGFHAFCVDIFKDIEEELPGEYELIDDLEFDKDEDFHRLHHVYENELDYLRKLLLQDPDMRAKNYLYDETFFLPIEKEGHINTAIGPMDTKEFATVDLHDLMDAFYVWNDWDRDARFYKNAALTLLAKEGVGIYSKMNETTEKNANTICDYLEIAYEKDPQQPLPVKEYERLVFELGRDNLLKNAIAMEQEAVAYREKEVYHLFEDVKVVADGAAERSYDPVNQSINLMAPYKDEGEWSWLIQASKNPSILEDYEAVSKTEPIPIENGHVWINDWYEDGIYHIDAILNEGERWLYIHDVAANEKDLKYLKECIKQSGFLPLN
jgi:tetratricopeptide (TPR) repeat protein